jgi:hypothetical protein
MSSNSLVLTPVDGEPRIHDLALAERLGFSQPRDIRKIIKRNEAKLLKLGTCAAVARVINGGEAVEFYLNKKQSIFIAMKSETEKAFEVQEDIIHVYDAYLNGNLDGKIASQPRLYRDMSYAVRVFDLSRDAFARQMMINTIKHLARQIGIAVPDMTLVGKPADQMQLEV